MAASIVSLDDILVNTQLEPEIEENVIENPNIAIKEEFSNTLEIDLSVKCRGCFAEDSEMHYLFTVFDQQLSLADILFQTASVVCKEGDEFPPYLCTRCTTCVIDFFNFKIQFKKTELYVQTLLGKQSVPDQTIKHENDDSSFTTQSKPFTMEMTDVSKEISEDTQNEENQADTEHSNDIGEVFDDIQDNTLFIPKVNGLTVLTPQSCKECDQYFEDGTRYETHAAKVHGQNPFIKFRTFRQLVTENDKAVAEVKKERKLLAQASRRMVSGNPLIIGEGKFCRICNRIFPEDEYLNHRETHKVHVCETCGYRCIKKSDLTNHKLSIHSSERNFCCSLCGKAYKTKQLLKRHDMVHLNLRPYCCEICGQRFNGRNTLNTHVQLKHIRTRDFICPICGLGYPIKATLDKHILRHNKNRPAQHFCDECGTAFKDRSSLKRHHLVKHTNTFVRPSCNFCGKTYCSTTKLRYHIERHHSGKPVVRKKRGRKKKVPEDYVETHLSCDSTDNESTGGEANVQTDSEVLYKIKEDGFEDTDSAESDNGSSNGNIGHNIHPREIAE